MTKFPGTSDCPYSQAKQILGVCGWPFHKEVLLIGSESTRTSMNTCMYYSGLLFCTDEELRLQEMKQFVISD